MIFADLVNGDSVFLDANILIYHFGPHPQFGPACNQLVQRIEDQDLLGFTSTHIVTEVAHRLMTLEAATLAGWSSGQVTRRLRQQPATILSQQIGSLNNDALIVAVMQANGLSKLASHDVDLDRTPGLDALRPSMIS
jgi:predicted nucleic acid-binding protein